MWHSSKHSYATKQCSNAAYNLESTGEGIFMLGVVFFIIYLLICPFVGFFYSWQVMWLILIPVVMIIISMIMRGYAQAILDKKGFRYDSETDTAWIGDEEIIMPEVVKQNEPTINNDIDQIENVKEISKQAKETKKANIPNMMKAIQGHFMTEDFIEVCRQAAQQGNVDAMCNLGLMYTMTDVAENYKEVLAWIKQAADQGNAIGQFCLGLLHLEEAAVIEDTDNDTYRFESYRYKNKVVIRKQWRPQSLTLMTIESETKNNVELSTAANWFRLAAEQGLAVAQYNLGLIYEKGIGVTLDKKEAFKWYQLAAEQDECVAQYSLGLMYWQGEDMKQDKREAFKWFQRAAENGQTDAQNALGVMYMQGEFVERDYTKAIKWFQLASDENSIDAAYNLGIIYLEGRGVKQDIVKAISLMGQAAKANDKDAMIRIRKLAENGHEKAQNYLGFVFQFTKRNYLQAAAWYHLAAEQGAENAIYLLSQIYRYGRVIKKDLKESVWWNKFLFGTLRLSKRKIRTVVQKARQYIPEPIYTQIFNKLSYFCLPWDSDLPEFKTNQYYLASFSGICSECGNNPGRIRYILNFEHMEHDQLCDQCFITIWPYSLSKVHLFYRNRRSGVDLGPFRWDDKYDY